MNRVRTLVLALSVVAATALIAGCDSAGSTTAEGESITVFAAASLKSAFTEIGEQFETDNPGSSVEFSFAGSSDLVTQLTQGAEADVFASADVRNMDRAVAAGLVEGAPVDFASNTLTIVVAPGNPKGIKSFADLTKPGVSVVVCAPPVPCGGATEKVEKATGVTLAPVSEETSVTDVLGKVTSGQADAGLVYLTDAAGAKDKVASVAVPEAAQAVNTYPIAVLKDSGHAQLAQRFVELVTGEAGQKALAKAGFAKP
ncbi:molybdate ABC transporter substrate-binding protein [Mycolicibacterium conceptionense]|uniref:Molybdate-binding protein n=1 Tax=Mycolicibacterium conceptionense TaxID=451644 RepID=A0A0U1DFV8_9MYCO|nr:molybdate ABC transporter substrate-binding protein [Mycolicibacterium conceptionense]OMB83264.1 molybdate ABC transporter substrate-binding protein [Mycolicibacterium conceptionense]OMB84947.1 molybdate ABC transporter substrate-binding protein [Mycolicibacterium conceptionense]ORV20086.1 molybdate-binding protein [Mycolicibacterium conceptionense]CQD15569.1 molybdenum ABC transporter periplasmic molybdate-binding protein [Mycolicibacterium conceptionense]